MPYGKGPIKTGKGKDKLKEKARQIISNPKKSDRGDERKLLKKYEKSYGKLKSAGKLSRSIDAKWANTLGAILKKKPSEPKRPGGR